MKLVKNIHKDLLAKTYKTYKNSKVIYEPGVSVFTHCVISGIVCKEFIKYLPKYFVEKYNLENYPLWVARHDIGKISPGFQYRLECVLKNIEEDKNKTNRLVMRHEQISAEYLKNTYEKLEEAECILSMIRWHHGGNKEETYDNGTSKFSWESYDHSSYGDREWDEKRDTIDKALIAIFGSSDTFIDTWAALNKGSELKSILDSDVKYMMGFLSICDWIASDDCNVFNVNDFIGDTIDLDLISEYANNAICKFGLDFCNVKEKLAFKDLFKFNAYSFQNTFPKLIDDYGLYIIEAPMGYGKTEAALNGAYLAMQNKLVRGIYFALPTQMTSNSMFDRYKNFVTTICNSNINDIRLVHSKAIYLNSDNSCMPSWFNGNKRGTLSQFGLGTVDQALMSVITAMKHFYIRSFGLANKCIIIDEIHSYDVYTGKLIKELIDELINLKCVVIVLSATLTAKNRSILTGELDFINRYPLITKMVNNEISYHYSKEIIDNRKFNIFFQYLHINGDFIKEREKVLKDCLDKASKGQKILWIENTVKDSQEIYQWFNSYSNPNIELGLLNSRFTNKDRIDNESHWVSLYGKDGNRDNDKGMILISTQICEQSIDIDADFLVSALCPSDMLLQRIGRLHRHYKKFKRDYIPECIILCPEALNKFESKSTKSNLIYEYKKAIGSSSYVYSPYILRRTCAIWNPIKSIELPKDIRKLLESTYDDSYIGNSLDIELCNNDAEQKEKDIKDANSTLRFGFGKINDDFESNNIDELIFNTRKITMASEEVYLVNKIEDKKITTIYGDIITLSTFMSISDKKNLNYCGIKVLTNDIKKHNSVFKSIKIGKIDYKLCIFKFNNGISIDNNGLNPNIQYNNKIGLVINHK